MTSTIDAAACATCGHHSWPAPKYCPEGCGAVMQPVTLNARGVVYSTTTIAVAHERFGETYQVAYVDLAEGPRLFGHVAPGATVDIDTVVDITIPDASASEATAPAGPVFAPLGEDLR